MHRGWGLTGVSGLLRLAGWSSSTLPAAPARAGARPSADHDADCQQDGRLTASLNLRPPRSGPRLPVLPIPSAPRRESRLPLRQETCPQQPAAAEPQRSRRIFTASLQRHSRTATAKPPQGHSESTALQSRIGSAHRSALQLRYRAHSGCAGDGFRRGRGCRRNNANC